MNVLNNKCLIKYKPHDEIITSMANNFAYNPEVEYSEEKMDYICINFRFRWIFHFPWPCFDPSSLHSHRLRVHGLDQEGLDEAEVLSQTQKLNESGQERHLRHLCKG